MILGTAYPMGFRGRDLVVGLAECLGDDFHVIPGFYTPALARRSQPLDTGAEPHPRQRPGCGSSFISFRPQVAAPNPMADAYKQTFA
jgi:hypothetical protein